MKLRVKFFMFLFLSTTHIFSQFSEEPYVPIDSIKAKKVKIIGLPIAFYTPETNVGFGGGGQIFLLQNSNKYNFRKSNILVSGIYTLNNQLLIDINPEIYLMKGDYLLDMAYQFKIFPNSFWGIGGDTPDENMESYNMTSNEFSVAFIKRLPPFLNFGFEYFFNDYDITEVEEGGILDEGDVLGAEGARITGLGVIFNQDKRNNNISPSKGNLLQLKAQFSSQNFGASSDFNRFTFDARVFEKVGRSNVLAFQLYWEGVFGDVPFQAKSWYGGGSRARGYFRGRFIDDLLYVFQAEYRYKFHQRWSAAGFLLAGEVSDRVDNFFQNIKPSVGGGIRYKFNKSQDTLLRLDIGVGIDGNSGFYFGVNEAF
ncbi:outer membrane protein assembly factor [Lutimonas saemankumensis]|uniref:BamA/TamA family outer membrane protein n=1 Tax=Lutimonas saemankumensis TaxID=483016 RepID=UPI001CD6ACE3|nr:BamA/TamA family outer membrane protein [Lutimonas saemankumensis]MCA0932861.1 outer membrane protein assembly factor [Lutimonas saemankumensis]